MPTTSGVEALPLPQASDAPDGPGAFLSLIQAMQTGGAWVYPTLAGAGGLNTVQGKYPLQLAIVNADTPAKNGYYYWNGTSNTWVQLPLLTAGSTLVAPSSVAGSGVSLTNIGKIVLNNASIANVNGVFSSLFDNYLVEANVLFSGSSLLQINMRANGSDDTSPNYLYQAVQGSGSAASAGATGSATTQAFLNNQAAAQLDATAEVFAPAMAANTRVLSKFFGVSGTTQSVGLIAAQHGVASAFDGFTLRPSAAVTMSGTVRVYGLNNG